VRRLATLPASRNAGSFKKYGSDRRNPPRSRSQVPRIGDATPWLPEAQQHWGTLSVAPILADPGTLVVKPVPTILGDYRNFYANVRDTINGAASWRFQLGRLSCRKAAGIGAAKLEGGRTLEV